MEHIRVSQSREVQQPMQRQPQWHSNNRERRTHEAIKDLADNLIDRQMLKNIKQSAKVKLDGGAVMIQ